MPARVGQREVLLASRGLKLRIQEVCASCAMVTAVAQPQVRGAFMSLMSSIQMLGAGFASLISGMIITRTAGGQVEHYNLVGHIALAFGLMTIWIAGRLRVASAPAHTPVTQEEPAA